ncbi:hypothetical protein PGQ11_014761 [Apiospora arundinis]|uniref:Uncharacterized protein n=1 Tax=Apiospora arundinis TaxID=335852 RepID=A0ABR2HUP3_9PEZI
MVSETLIHRNKTCGTMPQAVAEYGPCHGRLVELIIVSLDVKFCILDVTSPFAAEMQGSVKRLCINGGSPEDVRNLTEVIGMDGNLGEVGLDVEIFV